MAQQDKPVGSPESDRAAPLAHIDAFDAAARGLVFEGETPLARLQRFATDLPAQTGTVQWSVQGAMGALGEPLLQVAVKADPLVTCQRCLAPFAWPVDEQTELHLVHDESELDEGDPDDVDLDGYDKVLGSSRFDVLAQVEDALILAMPYIARHDVCPQGAGAAGTPAEPEVADERPHPFAGLAALKDRLKNQD